MTTTATNSVLAAHIINACSGNIRICDRRAAATTPAELAAIEAEVMARFHRVMSFQDAASAAVIIRNNGFVDGHYKQVADEMFDLAE